MLDWYDELYPSQPWSKAVVVKPIPWLVRDLWQRGKINIMSGLPKSGKSRLMNWFLAGSFIVPNVLDLAIDAVPRRVLYLAGEEHPDDINARMLKYIARFGAVPRETDLPIEFRHASAMHLETERERVKLAGKLVDGGFDTLVIDPLRRVHAVDENKSNEMAPILNEFRRWSNQLGITLIGIHHQSKLLDGPNENDMSTWFRGSTDIPSIVDTGQLVTRANNSRLIVLRAGRFAPVDALDLLDGGDDGEFVFKRRNQRG